MKKENTQRSEEITEYKIENLISVSLKMCILSGKVPRNISLPKFTEKETECLHGKQ